MKKVIIKENLLVILGICVLVAVVLSGCGEGEIFDSNTNSVENTKRVTENADEYGEYSDAYLPMEEIKEAVINILGENYWPDRQLTVGELNAETGIGEEMYDDFLAEKLNAETDIDMMIIVKAKAEYLTEIETMMNAYRDALIVKYADRPQELGKVQASRIEVVDRYVCYVQLGGGYQRSGRKRREEVLAVCQQENERAVDIIERTILNAD